MSRTSKVSRMSRQSKGSNGSVSFRTSTTGSEFSDWSSKHSSKSGTGSSKVDDAFADFDDHSIFSDDSTEPEGPRKHPLIKLGMNPAQFTEALVWIASLRYPQIVSIVARLEYLLKMHILRNARRLDMDLFRGKFQIPAFLQAFRTYRSKLRKVYLYCANEHAEDLHRQSRSRKPLSTKKGRHAMAFKEFLQIARQARLVEPEGTLEVQDVKNIFANIQVARSANDNKAFGELSDDDDDEEDDGEPDILRAEDEIGYPDFLEGLVALAYVKYPNPYEPLVDRFLLFLKRDFLPVMLRLINL